MSENEKRCRHCKYFSAPGVKVGYCCINPPVISSDDRERWPTAWSYEFCGSFTRREEEHPPPRDIRMIEPSAGRHA